MTLKKIYVTWLVGKNHKYDTRWFFWTYGSRLTTHRSFDPSENARKRKILLAVYCWYKRLFTKGQVGRWFCNKEILTCEQAPSEDRKKFFERETELDTLEFWMPEVLASKRVVLLRDSPSRLRRTILSPPTRKKPLAPRVNRRMTEANGETGLNGSLFAGWGDRLINTDASCDC